MKRTIILVDDHSIVRAGFKQLLEGTGKFLVVAEAKDGHEGYSLYLKHKPDIIILDIAMEGVSGLDVLERILKKDRSAKVVMLSMFEDYAFVSRAINLGAYGYISKSIEPEKLFFAMGEIASGKRWIDADIALEMALNKISGEGTFTDILTPREFEVFCSLARGKSVSEIAESMIISEKTVGTHRTKVMDKLRINNLAELTRLAIRHQIITP
ncbi:MAG: response regulator transcription factor [Gammaproteobacteria bacterium]|nr:response regulator transcription factor [Gammaproteobacteria bacterium]